MDANQDIFKRAGILYIGGLTLGLTLAGVIILGISNGIFAKGAGALMSGIGAYTFKDAAMPFFKVLSDIVKSVLSIIG